MRPFGGFPREAQRRFAGRRWVVEAVIAGPPEAAPRFDFRRLFAQFVGRLAALVSTAVESGEFRRCDPLAAAVALLGAAELTVRARRIGTRLPAMADPDDGALDVVLEGLRAPETGRRRPGTARSCRSARPG